MTAASLSPPPPLHHRQDHDAKTKRCGRLGTPGQPHAAVRGRHDSARRRPGGWTHFDSGSVGLGSCWVGVVLVRKSECLWSSRRVSVRPSRPSSTSTPTVAPRPHSTAPHARRYLVSFSSPTARHSTPAGTHPLFAPRRQGPKPARHHAHQASTLTSTVVEHESTILCCDASGTR